MLTLSTCRQEDNILLTSGDFSGRGFRKREAPIESVVANFLALNRCGRRMRLRESILCNNWEDCGISCIEMWSKSQRKRQERFYSQARNPLLCGTLAHMKSLST